MVLSNKKLKQKLRAAVAESIANSESGSGPIQQKAPSSDSNPQSQSLKELLVSASQKPRLSKREKRRKIRSSEVGGNGNGKEEAGIRENGEKSSAEGVDDGDKKGKRKKKRKRVQETEQNAGGGGGGDGDGEVKVGKKKKKSNNKKKNKERWGKKGDKKEKREVQPQNEEENNIVADSQVTGEDARKVYVGGIPYYSTEDDIRSYFESCGTITEVDCMQFPESGKFRGIAIISFKTEEAAKRALALDGSDMGGLFLKILPYKGTTRTNKPSNFVPPVVEGYNRIYIGNLPWDITEDDLRKFLSGCNISSIRFGMDKETGEFRGYAHVDFSDSLSMNMAIKLDQEILCGRPVKVTSAIPQKNAKFQPNETSISAATTAVAADADATVTATVASTNDAVSNGGTNISSGKMRRRTCYICSEKGHISSACPKKPVDDSTNSTAT